MRKPYFRIDDGPPYLETSDGCKDLTITLFVPTYYYRSLIRKDNPEFRSSEIKHAKRHLIQSLFNDLFKDEDVFE